MLLVTPQPVYEQIISNFCAILYILRIPYHDLLASRDEILSADGGDDKNMFESLRMHTLINTSKYSVKKCG